jgi:ribonuclease Z
MVLDSPPEGGSSGSATIDYIVFLGTGSAVPSPGYRNTSSIALKLHSSKVILVDCGEGTQHQIMKSKSIKMG